MKPIPVRIWLAEDNDADVRLMREALDELALGYELHVFRNGEEALHLVDLAGHGSEPCPDLLILDLHLPKVDGPEVLRRFRANENCVKTPVMILSSLIAPAQHTYIGMFAGVSIQEKPMDLDGYMEIGTRIRSILDAAVN